MKKDPSHLMRMPMNRCQHITCKGMEVYGNDYLTPINELDRSHDFECAKTHRVMGPDGALVILSQCTPDRECYEPL
jgi:hypothetical protein